MIDGGDGGPPDRERLAIRSSSPGDDERTIVEDDEDPVGMIALDPVKTMTSKGRLRLLCLEDDTHMRAALTHALTAHDLDLVETIRTAKQRIASSSYAAWLLDVSVPDGSGLDLLAWARLRGHRTPALVMTGLPDLQLANHAQILGAEFVHKPYGKSHIDSFLARVTLELEVAAHPVRKAEEFTKENVLTPREGDVIRAIVSGVPRASLASELGIAESTVKTLVRRILKRTGHDNLDQVLRDLLRRH